MLKTGLHVRSFPSDAPLQQCSQEQSMIISILYKCRYGKGMLNKLFKISHWIGDGIGTNHTKSHTIRDYFSSS